MAETFVSMENGDPPINSFLSLAKLIFTRTMSYPLAVFISDHVYLTLFVCLFVCLRFKFELLIPSCLINIIFVPECQSSSTLSVGLKMVVEIVTAILREMMDGDRGMGEAEVQGGGEEPIGLEEEVSTNNISLHITVFIFIFTRYPYQTKKTITKTITRGESGNIDEDRWTWQCS